MAVKMNLAIITKDHAADPEIGFLAKSISKSNSCETAIPTARELTDAGENGTFWPVYFALGAEENVMSVEMRRSK